MTFQTQKLFLIRNILIKCVFGPASSSAVSTANTTCWHSSGCCPDSLPSFQVSSLSPALPPWNPSRGTAFGLEELQGVLAGTLS